MRGLNIRTSVSQTQRQRFTLFSFEIFISFASDT
jgi:hypothetical protein